MKTLANCKPSEFLQQTVKIKNIVSDWLEKTKIMEVRKIAPKLTEGMTEDMKAEAIKAQGKKNIMNMLDIACEKYPEETVKVLAVCCFIEPEEADNHPMGEYLEAFGEMIGDKSVISFFISLARLAGRSI